MVRKATEGYIKACTFPNLSGARFQLSNSEIIHSTWCQKSPDIGKKRQFSKVHLGSNLSFSNPSRNESLESISAYGDNKEIVISKIKNHKGDDVTILEVWTSENLIKTLNLTDLDQHGMVYFDNELGSCVLNNSKTKVAYIAEAKKAKNVPFFPGVVSKDGATKDDAQKEYGKEFTYNEEWGEQLLGRSQSVIVILDLNTWKLDVLLDLVPEHLCPGQLEWITDDILSGIVVDSKPYRLGLIYCTNRPSGIFKLDLTSNIFECIKEPKGVSCKRPKVSPGKKSMIWLETKLQENLYPGPHEQCFKMIAYDLQSKTEKVIIDMKDRYDPETDDFAGLYLMGQAIPKNVFINDHLVLWNANVDGNYRPMLVDLEQSSFVMMDNNHAILDVKDDKVIAISNDPLHPPTLKTGKINLSSSPSFDFKDLNNPLNNDLPEHIIAKKHVHDPNDGSGLKFSSIYLGPGKSEDAKGLIVWPHGGPHSVIPWAFSNDTYYFLHQGFACLLINYRGSIAQGQDSIMSLPGNVGDHDVKDCYQAFENILQENPGFANKSVLFGGSHGGFLVTHLVAQYPDSFKACIARNPVINIASMATVSDISDWTFNEAGKNFRFRSPEAEEMKDMFEKSPIYHVEKVKAPVFLMIGKDDLRVPPSQGVEYYHNLKALGKKVDMNWYEDNHPLGKVNNHSNVFINSVLFYLSILENN